MCYGLEKLYGHPTLLQLVTLADLFSNNHPWDFIFRSFAHFFKKKNFFNVDHYKILYWICHNIVSVLHFDFLAMKGVGC